MFTYQPALDGVRAVAVSMVLAFHAGFGWMSGGYVGVSMFFTLSGFLITSLALAEWDRTERFEIGAFYGRRVRRLIPASLMCIAAVAAAAAAGQFHGVPNLRRDVWAALGQVFNWVSLAAGDGYAEQMARAAGQRGPLDHYWSLAIEEQFYWLWPLALALILRRGRSARLAAVAALCGLAVVATAATVVLAGPAATYLSTPARLAEILLGCGLAVALHDRTVAPWMWLAAVAGLAVAAWAAVTWPRGSGPAYEGWMPAFAVASAAVVAGLQVDSPLRRALSAGPLVALGRISYGVYLYHWPVFCLIDERRTDIGTVPLFAVRVAVTVALALASYRLVERPVRTARVPWRPSVLGAALSCAVLAAAVVVVPSSNGSFTYASSAERAEAGIVAVGEGREPAGERPVRVLVVGDSTAYALGEGMIGWAAANPGVLQVTQGAAIGCGLNPLGVLPADEYREPCLDVVGRIPRSVAELRPDAVLAMVTLRDTQDREYEGEGVLTMDDERFIAHLTEGYRRQTETWLAEGARRVVWVVPPPPDYPRAALPDALDPERLEAYRRLLHGLAAEFDDVAVADLREWMDGQDAPPARDDGLHFSGAGARDVTSRYFVPLLKNL